MWIKEDGKMVEVTVDHPTPPSLPKDRWEELALRDQQQDASVAESVDAPRLERGGR